MGCYVFRADHIEQFSLKLNTFSVFEAKTMNSYLLPLMLYCNIYNKRNDDIYYCFGIDNNNVTWTLNMIVFR